MVIYVAICRLRRYAMVVASISTFSGDGLLCRVGGVTRHWRQPHLAAGLRTVCISVWSGARQGEKSFYQFWIAPAFRHVFTLRENTLLLA